MKVLASLMHSVSFRIFGSEFSLCLTSGHFTFASYHLPKTHTASLSVSGDTAGIHLGLNWATQRKGRATSTHPLPWHADCITKYEHNLNRQLGQLRHAISCQAVVFYTGYKVKAQRLSPLNNYPVFQWRMPGKDL